jgi:hypothetical protein
MSSAPIAGLRFNPYEYIRTPEGGEYRKHIAGTAAWDALTFELGRYMSGQVEGRSCLVAGPRGSGKTTLVKTACEWARLNLDSGCRLILVRLHGPSLLNPTGPQSAKSGTERIDPYEHVLRTLVINLYQTQPRRPRLPSANSFRFRKTISSEMTRWNLLPSCG